MSVTRDDVAKRAGVSSATVSYVINGGPRPVSAQARAKVLKAIVIMPNEKTTDLGCLQGGS